MPRVGLKIDCCLENLCSLEAPGEDFRWFLKINCGACGEITDWVYVSQEEQIPVKGGRGFAHMVLNCKLCGRESNMTIEEGSVKPFSSENSGSQMMVSFDCRGLEPVDWECRGGFIAKTEKGKTFELRIQNKNFALK